jgi:GPH family glycoside/pentoside/hexuronide:cation symporter
MRLEAGAVLPLWMKAGWAAGDVGIACYIGGTMAFLLFYATQAHGISPAWAGLALLIPRMIDVLLDPLMGAISDRTRSSMGRRRPYLLFGSMAFGASFYLTFSVPTLSSPLYTVLYIAGVYLLASTAYTVYSIPHSAMAAEMSTSYRERTSIVGFRMLGSRLGILVVGLAGPYIFSSQVTLKEGFRLFGLVFAAVICAGGLISFFATRDAPRIEVSTERFDFVREYRALLGNRPFVALFCVMLLQNVAIGMSATTLVYFLTIVMQVPIKYVGWFAAGAASVAMFVTPLWMRAGRQWGLPKRRMYTIAILLQITAYGGIFLFADASAVFVFVALFVLMGVGDAACQLAPHAMAPDTVEAGQLQSGVRSDGMIFGAISGCMKLGLALGGFLVSVTLSYSGFKPGEAVAVQDALAITGVRVAYCLIPVAIWAIALWLLSRYDLDEARHDRIRSQLAQRPD